MFRFLAVLGIVYLLYSVAAPSKVPEISYDGELYVGEEYSYIPSRAKTEQMVVFMKKSQGRGFTESFMYNAGVRFQLGLLSQDNYKEFEEIKSSGGCPASFLNRNAKMVLAIPESDEVMKAIKSIDEGDLVSITAMALREGKRHVDGHQLPLQISGAQIMLIQDLAL